MNSRTVTLLWVIFALGATSLGLIALGAASLGLAALRVVGLALLAAGGAAAAFFRWRRACRELDRESIAELETARERLELGDHVAAARAAADAATHATTSRTRNAALTTLAWAALGEGYPARAKAALERIEPQHALDLYCLAAIQSANGEPDLAIEALELARSARNLSCDGAKLLVDLYARQHRIDRAVLAALQCRELLGVDNCRIVVKAAYEAGAYGPAATLASALVVATPPPPKDVVERTSPG